MTVTAKKLDPRIYVADLAAYNAGKLHGVWIDLLDKDADDIKAEVDEMIAASPVPLAEEWEIHDTADLDGYTPNNFEEAAAIAELIDQTDSLAVIYWLNHGNAGGLEPWEYEENFRDAYVGVYASEEDFVEAQLSEQGLETELEKIKIGHQSAWQYLDMKAIASDWMISSYFSHRTGLEEFYIFRRD